MKAQENLQSNTSFGLWRIQTVVLNRFDAVLKPETGDWGHKLIRILFLIFSNFHPIRPERSPSAARLKECRFKALFKCFSGRSSSFCHVWSDPKLKDSLLGWWSTWVDMDAVYLMHADLGAENSATCRLTGQFPRKEVHLFVVWQWVQFVLNNW